MTGRWWWPAGALGALGLLVSASLTWVTGTAADPVLGSSTVAASGSQAGTLVVAAALLAGAGLVAGLLGSRSVRILAAACLLLTAALAGWQAGTVIQDPVGALEPVVAERTGRSGASGSVGGAEVAGGVWLAAVSAVLLLAAAAGGALRALATPPAAGGPRRRVPPPADPGERGIRTRGGDTWDSLSRGEDPTERDELDDGAGRQT